MRVTKPDHWRKQKRAFALLFMLLALALRVVYVPFHLAHEEHLGAAALHPSAHGSVHAGHADGDHDHDGHPPHSAVDHACELIAQRAPSHQPTVVLLALPPAESWLDHAACAVSMVAAPELRPPRKRPPIARRPRGPPAAA